MTWQDERDKRQAESDREKWPATGPAHPTSVRACE